jgi:hypothetical protein
VAKIHYELSATIPMREGKPVKDTKTVYIKHMSESMTNLVYENSTKVSSCCCSKGAVDFKISLDKQIYTAGETCNIKLEVNNSKSSASISHFEVSLHRSLQLTGKHKEKKTYAIKLGTKSFDSPVRARNALLSEYALIFPYKLDDTEHTVANSSTVKSELIECLYFIQVTGICSAKPNPRLNAYLPIA